MSNLGKHPVSQSIQPSAPGDRRARRRTAALAVGLTVVLAGCGGTSVFTAGGGAADNGTSPSTTLLQASSATSAAPVGGVVLYDVSDLVVQVRPGVVSVTETGMSMDMFLRPVQMEGEGTGIVIDGEGHILTNYHVISGAESVSVYAEDGRERSARVIFGDPATDIAILQVDDTGGLVPLVLGDSSLMEVGDPVIAMGNALGLDETSPTVSVGIVSALGRTIETDQAVLEDLIQTDAAINSGNSGGPLLNAAGEVIGINSAIASGAENIGFSISIDSVKDEIGQALSGVGVPFVGLTTIENSADLAARYRLTTDRGLIVTSVLPTSPAVDAGIEAGDIILSVDGVEVDSADQLDAAVETVGVGGTLTLTIQRGRSQGDLTVTVAER
jgi:serine protease Do